MNKWWTAKNLTHINMALQPMAQTCRYNWCCGLWRPHKIRNGGNL